MLRLLLGLIIISIFIGSCSQLTPIDKTQSIVGQWRLRAYQIYNLPKWYVTKYDIKPYIYENDSIYSSPAPEIFDVNSLTFVAGGAFSQLYYLTDSINGYSRGKAAISNGFWTQKDLTVDLSISNNQSPNQLTYKTDTDQLVTPIYKKTLIVKAFSNPIDTVSYSIRIYYERWP